MAFLILSHLQVPVHDAVLVEVADSLQHLLDDLAGVSLSVDASIQDAIKQLTARHSVCVDTNTQTGQHNAWACSALAVMQWLKWLEVQRVEWGIKWDGLTVAWPGNSDFGSRRSPPAPPRSHAWSWKKVRQTFIEQLVSSGFAVGAVAGGSSGWAWSLGELVVEKLEVAWVRFWVGVGIMVWEELGSELDLGLGRIRVDVGRSCVRFGIMLVKCWSWSWNFRL